MALETRLKKFDQALTDLGIRVKDADQRKIWGSCLDDETLGVLYRLAHRRVVAAYGGPVKTGKEANVFHALGPKDEELAVKVYRSATGEFRSMGEYMAGDPRFKSHRRDRRDIVRLWASREFKNLEAAHAAGVKVPRPLALEKNVLVMEFIGVDGMLAPTLKEVAFDLTPGEGLASLAGAVRNARLLYHRAGLVHGDLSEYNMLYFDGPVFIDFGQAVLREHPRAPELLRRDATQLARFFSRWQRGLTGDAVLQQIQEPPGPGN